MIYFTEITKPAGGEETIAFQFYAKELPETIPMMYRTKINHIEYNGGFITNQIIGTFQEPIEWEGCFFGKYTINNKSITAKERAMEIYKFMGRPIRVGFPPPSSQNHEVQGFSEFTNIGKSDKGIGGDVGMYIIEEYEMRVNNYMDVDYRIRLIPHMRQEKIKPIEADVIVVKVEQEVVTNAGRNAAAAVPKGSANAKLKGAAASAYRSGQVWEEPTKPNLNKMLGELNRGQVPKSGAVRFGPALPPGFKPPARWP